MGFFSGSMIGGLMAGVLYSLVALGLVLIFKASGVYNFAQGAMVLFAALSLVRLMEKMPLPLALLATCAIMLMLAYAIERCVLRPLVNQPGSRSSWRPSALRLFIEGFGQILWGSDIYKLDLGIPKQPIIILEKVFSGGILVGSDDLFATVVSGALVVVLAIFSQKTRIGRALRAVADDHQAAQSIGIPLNQIWLIVWTVAGLVALVAGIIWGSRLGVAVFVVADRVESPARGDTRRLHVGAGCDPRRADHRRRRKNVGGVPRPAHRRRHRELVRVHARAAVPAGCGRKGFSARKSLIGSKDE